MRLWDDDRERDRKKAAQQPATASQSPTPAPAQPTPQQAEEEDEEAAEARRQAKARASMAQRAKDSPMAPLLEPKKRPSPLEEHFKPGGSYGDEHEQGHSQGIPGRRR